MSGVATGDNISVKKLTISEKPPSWAASAIAVPGVSLSSEIESTLVSPLTSKEHRPWYIAGFTCDECPNKYRPHHARNGDTIRSQSFCLDSSTIVWKSAWVASEPDSVGVQFTKRCQNCSTRMRTWTRSKNLADHITRTAEINHKRLRFVTLTLPNYDDVEFGIKDLKKKVRNFRYTKAYQDKVIGSADFYEWTKTETPVPDETTGRILTYKISYNVHYHAIWIGDYWPHDDLLDTWQHGGARIELVKNIMKNTKERRQAPAQRVMRYVMNYVKKMDRQGLRCQQRTGALYNDK